MQSSEYEALKSEIEKLKYHNTNLLMLIGSLHKDGIRQPSIHETIVIFDVSKSDLRGFTDLIKNYDGNHSELEKKALKINPVFKRDTIIFMIKSFIASEILQEQSR